MANVRENIAYWATRITQTVLDPVAVTVPGWGTMMTRIGPCRDRDRYVNAERLDRGLVLVLPGVEGGSLYTAAIRKGLDIGGVDAAIRIVNWAGVLPGWVYVFSTRAARQRARLVTEQIERYREQHPGRPVVVVGHSGGGAITAFICEQAARAGRPIAGAVGLATALGPNYDLGDALRGVRGGILTAHSPHDWQLRILTTIGGNFDRAWSRTAGQAGFARTPSHGAEKFEQLAWTPAMREDGHWGGHIGPSRPSWVARHIAPRVIEWMAAADEQKAGQ